MLRTLLVFLVLAVAAGAADPKRSAELERAYQDMVAAQHALDDAKERRDGLQPEEGDRAGTAKGTSRLKPDFFERQRSLEREVALAQWRYEQALERWTALR
jgi:hypothetical protein